MLCSQHVSNKPLRLSADPLDDTLDLQAIVKADTQAQSYAVT